MCSTSLDHFPSFRFTYLGAQWTSPIWCTTDISNSEFLQLNSLQFPTPNFLLLYLKEYHHHSPLLQVRNLAIILVVFSPILTSKWPSNSDPSEFIEFWPSFSYMDHCHKLCRGLPASLLLDSQKCKSIYANSPWSLWDKIWNLTRPTRTTLRSEVRVVLLRKGG